MHPGLLLASTLLLFQTARTLPNSNLPLRNTFVVAVETVIDNAGRVNLKAADNSADPQIDVLKQSQANLATMVQDDREKDILTVVNDMVFAVSACHLQATNGADTTTCSAQFDRARTRAMESIRKHKSGDTWVDGAPA